MFERIKQFFSNRLVQMIGCGLLLAVTVTVVTVLLFRMKNERTKVEDAWNTQTVSVDLSSDLSSEEPVSSEVSSETSSEMSSDASSTVSSTVTPAPKPTPVVSEPPLAEPMASAVKVAAGLSTRRIGYGFGYPDAAEKQGKNRPSEALYNQRTYGPAGMVCLTDTPGVIYLTMDEGYEAGYTARILDILKAKGATATFFVTGSYVREQPALVRRMIDEGHTIGNHTVSHPDMPTVSLGKAATEIWSLHETVKSQFGYEMSQYRPPTGSFSPATLAIAKALGYRTVEWSFAYDDYDEAHQPDKTYAFNRITGATHEGGVFLLHACSKTNTEILGDLIDWWNGKGLAVTALPNE